MITIVGNQASDQSVVEKNVGLCGLVEDKAGVMCVTEMQGLTYENVEEIGVLVEMVAENVGVNVL